MKFREQYVKFAPTTARMKQNFVKFVKFKSGNFDDIVQNRCKGLQKSQIELQICVDFEKI